MCLGAQEFALHAGAEESLFLDGGIQKEICRPVQGRGDPQGCLQVQRVAAGLLCFIASDVCRPSDGYFAA